MEQGKKKYFIASSVLIGSCVGAGFLGLPYVASKSGFFVAFIYLILLGGVMYLVNSFLGEVVLRTKGDHQLIGYTQKYLGKNYGRLMGFALIFGLYSALIAYMIGMGESLSYLFFGNIKYTIVFGIFVGGIMSLLLRGGMSSLKKFEKLGVSFILLIFGIIFLSFIFKIKFVNLVFIDLTYLFLPFGVVLFALINFHSIPEVKIILKGNEKYFRKVLMTSTIVSIIFYSLFTFVVLGFLGKNTPEVATLSLGFIFVVLGIFTMFTAYFAAGNALREGFYFDKKYSFNLSWFLASIIPIVIFILIQLTQTFSFTTILSIGGIVSGGITAILSLFMVNKAKKVGNRRPEYSVKVSRFVFWLLIFIFFVAVIFEIF